MFLKCSPPPSNPHLAIMLYPKQQEMNETLVFLGVRMSSRVRFSVDWHVCVKLVFRLLLRHFTNSTTCCITMTSHFCSFIMPLLHLLWLLTFFFFSAGLGGRGWGGGVIRQVQGLVSSTPSFFPLSTSFVFRSRVASFSDLFSTHTLHDVHRSTSMKSSVYWMWKLYSLSFTMRWFIYLCCRSNLTLTTRN